MVLFKSQTCRDIVKLTQSNLQIDPIATLLVEETKGEDKTLGFPATRSGTGWLGFGG